MFNNLFTPKNKKTNTEYFLAVEIHESLIKTAVWQVDNETPSIVALGSYELWDSEDSLINGVDASLTEAIKGLKKEPDRVILGLPDSWLSESKIHPTKQKLVKRLLHELALTPIGMVTIAEAIVSHLKQREGVPPTAILLEIYPSKVIVSLVNLGEIQAQEEVGRSDDLARDVEEGLARFEAEKLPARFILTNGSDLENEEQQIISYPWTEKLPFIHLPKVQVLPIDFSIRAIALSGGSEAAKSLGLTIASETEEGVVAESLAKQTTAVESITSDFSTLGFALEGESSPINEVSPAIENEPVVGPEPNEKKKKFSFPKLSLPQLSLPAISLPRNFFWFTPVAALLLIVASVAVFYFYFGTVKVVLSISPMRISKSLDLAIGTSAKDNLPTIIATKKTLSAKASETMSTTGEAVVGDKATGKVTIYNLSNQAVSLKAGAKITSTNNLNFILDSAVILASASGQFNENGPVFPSVQVDVTAGKIGAESNLDKLASFGVENYPKSTLIARADANFSGGSSRTVKAVAKVDQEKLIAQVSEKVKTAIDDQLKKEDPDNRFLPVGPLRYTAKNFDRNPGEEAATVSLDLAGDLDVLIYSKQEMLSQVEKQILALTNPGLVLAAEHTQIGLTDPVDSGNDAFTVKAQVDATLLPEIDEAKISRETKGKRATALKMILSAIPGYQSSTVLILPNLPLLNLFLPMNTNRFSYTISSN